MLLASVTVFRVTEGVKRFKVIVNHLAEKYIKLPKLVVVRLVQVIVVVVKASPEKPSIAYMTPVLLVYPVSWKFPIK